MNEWAKWEWGRERKAEKEKSRCFLWQWSEWMRKEYNGKWMGMKDRHEMSGVWGSEKLAIIFEYMYMNTHIYIHIVWKWWVKKRKKKKRTIHRRKTTWQERTKGVEREREKGNNRSFELKHNKGNELYEQRQRKNVHESWCERVHHIMCYTVRAKLERILRVREREENFALMLGFIVNAIV